MTTLRAGLIGLGIMGRNHARVLRQLEGVELVGVVDPVGDRFGIADGVPMYETAEELLDRGVDVCVLAAPTSDHEPLGLMLAEAGVHTLIEKPLAEDVAAGQRLVEAFRSRGLIGAVGHIERYNPALQELRRRLELGELGEIYQLSTRRVGPFPGRIRDVGVVKDLATHDIDLTAWVSGSSYASVAARTAHKSGRDHEDLVAVTGLLTDGTVVNHLVNWLSPMKERVILVTGERGAFLADTVSADLTFFENGEVATEWEAISRFRGVSEGNMIRFAIKKPEPLSVELAAFRDAVLGHGHDIVTLEQGLEAVIVAEAIIESSRDGRTVSIGAPQPASA